MLEKHISRPIVKLSEEELKNLNKLIEDYYGRIENLPCFRVVWSDDCYEQRWMEYTNEGFKLLNPEVREVPKYKHYIQHKYILEGLQAKPSFVQSDLVDIISYEPLWTFEDRFGEFLTPSWGAVRIVLDTVKHNQENPTSGAKYSDPELDRAQSAEDKRKRLEEIERMLFGNETDIGDALAYREGVTVPSNYGVN